MVSPRAVWIIAINTYREIIRDRILYGMFVFAILLIGLSLALGQLSYAEQTKISIDFGFTAIHLCAVILSVFVGSTLVGREIEKKTILTLLVRPITRAQFLIGKSFGLLSVIAVAVLLLAGVLALTLIGIKVALTWSFITSLYGILLEAFLLLAVTIFFGTFASPMLSVSFSLGIFLIGHWLESLKYFGERSQSELFKWFVKGVSAVHPNLEIFNWRSLVVYEEFLSFQDVVWATFYGIAWFVFLTAVSSLILSRRDLG